MGQRPTLAELPFGIAQALPQLRILGLQRAEVLSNEV